MIWRNPKTLLPETAILGCLFLKRRLDFCSNVFWSWSECIRTFVVIPSETRNPPRMRAWVAHPREILPPPLWGQNDK
ncbi:MAG: hypothetical protein A3B04_01545 [Candidatus Portnoybacteria bacterium RIFCSPLOWO2_02_FULL_39_11]|uniref:Uncharacterized protein n=1 Tax=Candidatus Portnoybacteria bacterium RIFCSPLOWO2_02_FULL_39_11 TaxID=1802001 RepID=A0A1G2FQZ8_9BACT|nr:MAG: hypothetical protein A3B04_01545 [Candidatus Portnoybacteria bacterium RIFCSPLOWO2_02_FULL_39_11]